MDDTICVCGHPVEDHHTSWWFSTGAKIIEECENPECENAPWDQRCLHFREPKP